MLQLRNAIASIAKSRLGAALCAVHLAFVIGVFSEKQRLSPEDVEALQDSSATALAARFWHHAHESLPLKTVTLLDLPSLLPVALLTLPLGGVMSAVDSRLSAYSRSYMAAAVLLVATSIQWWVVGTLIEARRKNLQPRTQAK